MIKAFNFENIDGMTTGTETTELGKGLEEKIITFDGNLNNANGSNDLRGLQNKINVIILKRYIF